MSRKYSIGFLIGIVILIILFIVGYKISYNHAIEHYHNIEEDNYSDYNFVLKDKEGYITVYQDDGRVYEYTSISSSDLPETIQEDLKIGIGVDNIGEVYGFLENYSS